MNKPIRVRVHDSAPLAGTFANKTIEKLTAGDPANIGRDVERLTARLLNVHHARRHRTAAEELALRDRLGAAWNTAAKTLDMVERVVLEAEGVDRKAAAPNVPFPGTGKTKDTAARSMADVIGDISKANREFWKSRE